MRLVRLAQEALARRPSYGETSEARCDSTMSAPTTAEGMARFLSQQGCGDWILLLAEIRAGTNVERRRLLAEEATSQASDAVDMVDEEEIISPAGDELPHTRL